MNSETPRFFQSMGPLLARLGMWNKRFSPVLERLKNTALQKISASDDGYLTLGVYKPGDDRSVVVFSIRKGESGVSLEASRPSGQPKPNAFVQIARKYLVGRRIANAYMTLERVAIVLEFSLPHPDHPERKTVEEGPDALILDLDSRPPRLSVAKRHSGVPKRYQQCEAAFPEGWDFFESFCEWSVESTKTKRHPTFEEALTPYCVMPMTLDELESKIKDEPAAHVVEPQAKPPAQGEMTPAKAFSLLPPHVRRAAKTRLQFLERRLLRQKADLPGNDEISRLEKRAEGLRSHLYLWPKDSPVWYVPPHLIEEFGLPAFYRLKHGNKPGDLLEDAFHELERLKRRRSELLARTAESDKAARDFLETLLQAGNEIQEQLQHLADAEATDAEKRRQTSALMFARIHSESAERICAACQVSWHDGAQKRKLTEELSLKKQPYRTYFSSTGEFIRVSKSAHDADAMIKLMPAHHYWLHILTGEGSHVWLEKPKGGKPSAEALHEAAVLAVAHSRHGKSFAGEVRVATRADIEKKKDLAPGKVLVRRCETILCRYSDDELQQILATMQ